MLQNTHTLSVKDIVCHSFFQYLYLILCISGTMFFSHIMIPDILLCEISLSVEGYSDAELKPIMSRRETQRGAREGDKGVTGMLANST